MMGICRKLTQMAIATLFYVVLGLSALIAGHHVRAGLLHHLRLHHFEFLAKRDDRDIGEIFAFMNSLQPPDADLRYSVPALIAFLLLSIIHTNRHLRAFLWLGFFVMALGFILIEFMIATPYLRAGIERIYTISTSLYLAILQCVAAFASLKISQFIQPCALTSPASTAATR